MARQILAATWPLFCGILGLACNGTVFGDDTGPSASGEDSDSDLDAGDVSDDDDDDAFGTSGGSVGDSDTQANPDDTDAEAHDCASSNPPVGESLMRRLTRVEYQLSIQSLLALESPPDVTSIPDDPNEEGFRTVASLNSLSAQHLRAYMAVAAEQAAALMADPVRRPAVLGCAPGEPSCLTSFVERFGRLAFRRSLTPEESTALVTTIEASALDETDAFTLAIEAFLVSPSFIFRVEGSGDPGVVTPLDDYEVASRLAFALWGRGPSADLLDAAERGELATLQGLATHAERMLDDPRSQAFYESFFEQWIGFESLRQPNAAPTGWYPEILEDFKRETHDVLARIAWSEDASFLDIFTSNETVPSERLAEFYGLQPDANGIASFPSGDPRANSGILTHPAVLSAKSDGDLIAKRGAWFRRTFLCQTFEVPPGLFETLGDRLVGLTFTEIVAERNNDTACKGCHAMLDPIGVGLLPWDGAGLFDPTVETAGFGIEPAIPGIADPSFETAADIGQRLQSTPEVQTCLGDRIFLYTHGREPEWSSGEHECSVDGALERFGATGRFVDLLLGIVSDPQFRLRKNPA